MNDQFITSIRIRHTSGSRNARKCCNYNAFGRFQIFQVKSTKIKKVAEYGIFKQKKEEEKEGRNGDRKFYRVEPKKR